MGPAAFGLSLLPDVRPPGPWASQALREPTVQIRSVASRAIADSWSGFQDIGWEGVIDGAPFVVERGVAGDHLFVHGVHLDHGGVPSPRTRAVHHLSADASVLQCAPADRSDPSWWRVVLDSVLFSVALLHGYEALHVGAVATPDGVVAIAAGTGGGKSTLLAELISRGLTLMADDVLVLEARGSSPPLAHPAPPLMTVPASSVASLSKLGQPNTISSIGEERWIGCPVHPQPLALRALVLLDRQPGPQRSGSRASLVRIERPLAPLLGSFMNFPRVPERQQTRFELASVLASELGLWRLTASLDTSPETLADTLLAGEPWKHGTVQAVV